MIDFERIRRERNPKRVLSELLVNVPELLLILYGLKCLVTLDGTMVSRGKGAGVRSLHLTPVAGTLAVTSGLAYVGFGLFLYFSDGNPPAENCGWLWRIGRALLRWGGLALGVWAYIHADNVVTRSGFDLKGLPPLLLVKISSFFVGFLALLVFLLGMFQREQVKRELSEHGCKPLHVWWQPAAYWVSRYWVRYWDPTGFRVVYADRVGNVHRAHCIVFRSFRKNSQWGSRRVLWLTDTVAAQWRSTGSSV